MTKESEDMAKFWLKVLSFNSGAQGLAATLLVGWILYDFYQMDCSWWGNAPNDMCTLPDSSNEQVVKDETKMMRWKAAAAFAVLGFMFIVIISSLTGLYRGAFMM